MTTRKLLFENVTCPRCGGSGKFSYCQMHGDRCFKCHGDGVVLTKRGRAAQIYLGQLRSVRADELQIGDQIFEEDFLAGRTTWARVTRIALEGPSQDSLVIETPTCTHGCGPETTFRKRRSKAEARVLIDQALAYQATLTKQGLPPKKRSRKAA